MSHANRESVDLLEEMVVEESHINQVTSRLHDYFHEYVEIVRRGMYAAIDNNKLSRGE